MHARTRLAGTATLIALLAGCAVEFDGEISGSGGPPWEEFLADTHREPWEHGVFVVNGDTPIESEKQLREFYDQVYSGGALIVHRAGGQDARWSDSAKRGLTYCVSNSFGGRKAAVVAAMAAAVSNWESAADVDFHYIAAQDGSCNGSNGNVVFDVRPSSNQPYLARAFFPNNARSARNVIIDSSAHTSGLPLANILTHELGHTLGFRHEHTRPEAGQCFEDNSWRALTPYDTESVMFYPQCGATGPVLTMSDRDRAGAASLYGPPGGDDDDDDDSGDRIDESNLSGGAGTELFFQMTVPRGGKDVSFTMSGGSGDADLYVKKGSPVSAGDYDCRPFVGGNDESCDGSGEGTYYVMVRGYTSFSGVRLRGTYTAGGGGDGETVVALDERDLSGAAGAERRFTVNAPSGTRDVVFEMAGGSGDADLYVRKGAAVSQSQYDCRPYTNGNTETCAGSGAGTYNVMVRGYSSFSGVRLRATYRTQ